MEPLFELRHVSKIYKSKDAHNLVNAVNDVTLSFSHPGLIMIMGKSGSGKSTLLHLLGLIDKPTSGEIYFQGEKTSKWTSKRIDKYHSQDIGFVFQQYSLLEDESVLYNIMLPMLIIGEKEKYAKEDATTLLKSIKFPESLYQKKCKELSGGEMQRVAILRALINDPKIILADEPTGALDSENGEIIMSILKKISKTKLVFMVTHNQELATRFADRIITIKDGRVHLDKKINTNNNSVYINKAHKRSLFSSWSNKILKSNLKKRIPRHVLSFFALLTGLTSSILIGCFSLSAGEAIKKASYRQFDYGSATIAKESTQQINGSPISLVKMSRPNKTELKELSEKYFRFHFFPNFDYLFPNSMVVKTQSSKELDLSFISTCNPNSSHHSALLKKGKLMDEDNLFEMVINESCYDYIKKETDLEPLGLTLNIKHDFLYRNYVDESNYVDEIYSLDETFKIVGIVDELTFLSTPKVFYSYRALSSYLANKMMEKTSLYLGYEYSWLNKVTDCGDNEILSSYSYRIFLKENEELEEIEKAINEANDDFKIDSNSYTITSSLLEITNASNLGMDIFLAIALIGSVLLLGIVTFSCYSDDRSKLALFSILGSSKKENIDLIAQESLIVGLSSSTFSLILAPLIALLINKICSLMGLSETLIVINYGMLFGIPYFIPLFTIIITIIICLLSTYVPLLFSHKNSLREELSLS